MTQKKLATSTKRVLYSISKMCRHCMFFSCPLYVHISHFILHVPSRLLASPGIDSYAMNGLSADKLRLLLQPVDGEDAAADGDGALLPGGVPGKDSQDRDDGQDATTSLRRRSDRDGNRNRPHSSQSTAVDTFRQNVPLTTVKDSTRGQWKDVQVMYSYPSRHRVRANTLALLIVSKKGEAALTTLSYLSFVAADIRGLTQGRDGPGPALPRLHCRRRRPVLPRWRLSRSLHLRLRPLRLHELRRG